MVYNNFMNLMGVTVLNSSVSNQNSAIMRSTQHYPYCENNQPTQDLGNVSNQNSAIMRSTQHYPSQDLGNVPNKHEHYEGEFFYDPATLQPKRVIIQPDGTPIAVPSEDYEACRSKLGGYAQSVGGQSQAYGYSTISGTYGVRSIPDTSYITDKKVYLRHLFRLELKERKLKGVGINTLDVPPTVNRDDKEICKFVINKFNNNMATRFEQRLKEALLEKEALEEKKNELLKSMNLTMSEVKENFKKNMKNFKEELMKERKNLKEHSSKDFFKELEEHLKNNDDKFNTPIQKPEKKETIDDDYVNYYLAANYFIDKAFIKYGEEEGIKMIYFDFDPPIDEDSEELDPFAKIGCKISKTEQMVANKDIRSFQKESGVTKKIGNFLGKFSKKKYFVKQLKIEYSKILEIAKEKYTHLFKNKTNEKQN